MINNKTLLTTLVTVLIYASSPFTQAKAAEITKLADDLNILRRSLIEAGYKVKIDKPPMQGAYGLVNIKNKTMWIAPITKEMGIFRTTFLHEAVRAAQACKTGELNTIGWKLDVDKAVKVSIESILYRKYPSNKFDIEREAFQMQGQPDAVKKIINALEQNC